MRPDQHKKKKSVEYKKKHGIPNQAKKESGESATARSKSDETETSKQLETKNGRTQRSSDSDEDRKDEEESDHGRSFSKRKIESNLDRYKEQELDEEYQTNAPFTVSKIGANFQSLLDKTAGPSSHFLFQGEKDWENFNENEVDAKVGSTLMSVDFKALAQDLGEIPLDRRLGIDKKYLEDEPLCVKMTSIDIEKGQKVTSHVTKQCVTAQVNVTSDNSKQTFSAGNFNFSKPKELPKKTKDKGDATNNHKIALPTTEVVQLGTNHVKKAGGNCITEEDDLDQLLELKTAGRNSIVEVTCNNVLQNGKEYDETLVQDTFKKMDKAPEETKEDLEDWLDSILD